MKKKRGHRGHRGHRLLLLILYVFSPLCPLWQSPLFADEDPQPPRGDASAFLALVNDEATNALFAEVFPEDFPDDPAHLSLHRRALRSADLLFADIRSVFLNLPVPETRLYVLAELGLYDRDRASLLPLAQPLQIRYRWTLSRLRALKAEDRRDFFVEEMLYRTIVRGPAAHVLGALESAWPCVDPDDVAGLLAAQGLAGLEGGQAARAALSPERRRAFDEAWGRAVEAIEGKLYAVQRDEGVNDWWRGIAKRASFAAGADRARIAATFRAHAAWLARRELEGGETLALDELARRIGKPGWSEGLSRLLRDLALLDGAIVITDRGEVRLDPSRRPASPSFDDVLDAQLEGNLTEEQAAWIDPMLAVASRSFAAGKGDVDAANQANRYAFFETHPEAMPYANFRQSYFEELVDVHARSFMSYLLDRAVAIEPVMAAIRKGVEVEGATKREESMARAFVDAGYDEVLPYYEQLVDQVQAIRFQRGVGKAREALRRDALLKQFFDRNITNNLYRELLTVDAGGERWTLYAIKVVLDRLRGNDPPYPATISGSVLAEAFLERFRAAGVQLPPEAIETPDLAKLSPDQWRSTKSRNVFAKLLDLVGYRVSEQGAPPTSVGSGYPLAGILSPIFDLSAPPGEQLEFEVTIDPLIALPRTRASTVILALPGAGRLGPEVLEPALAPRFEDLSILPQRSYESLLAGFAAERDPFGPTSWVAAPLNPGTVDRAIALVSDLEAGELLELITAERRRVLGLALPVDSLAPIARRRLLGDRLPSERAKELRKVLLEELKGMRGALAKLSKDAGQGPPPDPSEVLDNLPGYGIDLVVWAALLGSDRLPGATRADRFLRVADFQKKGTFSESVLNELLNPADPAFRLDYPFYWFEYSSRERSHDAAWSELLPKRVYYTRQLYGKPQIDLVIPCKGKLVCPDPKTGGSPFDEAKWKHWFGLLKARPGLWFEKNPRYRGLDFHTRPVLIHTRASYPLDGLDETLVIPFRDLNERIRERFGETESIEAKAWEAFAAERFELR